MPDYGPTRKQLDRGFIGFIKEKTGLDEEAIQEIWRQNPKFLKDDMNDYLSLTLGGETHMDTRKKGNKDMYPEQTGAGLPNSDLPNTVNNQHGLPMPNPQQYMRKSPLPLLKNMAEDSAWGAGFGAMTGGAPGAMAGAISNPLLGGLLAPDREGGTWENTASNVAGGLVGWGKVNAALKALPVARKIPNILQNTLIGAASRVAGGQAANLTPDALPYATMSGDPMKDEQGKPITVKRNAVQDALVGGGIGAVLGIPGAIANKVSDMRDAREAAKMLLDTTARPSIPIPVNKAQWNKVNPDIFDPAQKITLAKAYAAKPSEFMTEMVTPLFEAESFGDLPKLANRFNSQLEVLESLIPQPQQNVYPRLKKTLIDGLRAREVQGSSGLENADSFREVFHNLGKETTEKLFGKGMYKELMTVFSSASRSMKSSDTSKYALDNASGVSGMVKKGLGIITPDNKMFQGDKLASGSELANAMELAATAGLGATKKGGLSPISGAGLALGVGRLGTYLNHGLPDNLANKLNRMSPQDRKKAIAEILLKYGQQPYSPLTTQLSAGNGNE